MGPDSPLIHHELCFGCGRTNVFGLLAELHQTETGHIEGRCFIKQDHQGAERGFAHEGVIASALTEAMGFACGPGARARAIEIEIVGRAPVGGFLELQARYDDGRRASARAVAAGEEVARAHGVYAPDR